MSTRTGNKVATKFANSYILLMCYIAAVWRFQQMYAEGLRYRKNGVILLSRVCCSASQLPATNLSDEDFFIQAEKYTKLMKLQELCKSR